MKFRGTKILIIRFTIHIVIISPLEPCDAPKMKKYRPKYDRCTNKQIAKRRKKNKNRKTHRRK